MQFAKPGKATVIVGGQFGSEAKGLAAAYVASQISAISGKLICTTNAGAQAGHTTILENGEKMVCYHLPTIGALEYGTIYLNAGSIIDPDLLRQEIQHVAAVLGTTWPQISNRLVIHPNAAVIYDENRAQESHATRHLGSTQKGVGSALASKIMRHPMAVAARDPRLADHYTINAIDLNEELADNNATVTVEIPQGTDLSINASQFYPKCTSRDCWLGQGLTDAGIHPHFLGHAVMVVRTLPIRVGHITDATGEIVGHSGNFYPDSIELDWAQHLPGTEPERTTVTKRVRRIASWSDLQYLHALRLNRPDTVMLTFTNYLTLLELDMLVSSMRAIEHDVLGNVPRHLYSWGPKVSQVSPMLEDCYPHCRAG